MPRCALARGARCEPGADHDARRPGQSHPDHHPERRAGDHQRRLVAWWNCRSATTLTTTTCIAPPRRCPGRSGQYLGQLLPRAFLRRCVLQLRQVGETPAPQDGAASRSQYAQSLLRPNPTTDPVANIFGQNLSAAAVDAIAIHSGTSRTPSSRWPWPLCLAGRSIPGGSRELLVRSRMAHRAGRSTSLTRICVPATSRVSTPAFPVGRHHPREEIFAEVRVPLIADVPGIPGTSASMAPSAARTMTWMASAASLPTCTAWTGASMTRSRSGAGPARDSCAEYR